MLNKRYVTKVILLGLAIILIWFGLVYAIGKERFLYVAVREDFSTLVAEELEATPELINGAVVEQPLTLQYPVINSISLYTGAFGRSGDENQGTIWIEIVDAQTDEILAMGTGGVSQIPEWNEYEILLDAPLREQAGTKVLIRIFTDSAEGKAAAVFTKPSIEGEVGFSLNGKQQSDRVICIAMDGARETRFGKYYWPLVASFFVLLLLHGVGLYRSNAKGKTWPGLGLLLTVNRYSFLIKQLVSRDFKTKYKRSALGVFWSFLNPLLTMSVQYIVFSMIFRQDIENYPVYLLIGIVCFNYFNEACSMALSSITGNAALINKVYVPKYIFPVTRCLSSGINLLMALIPLGLVILFTGTKIAWSYLLLPYAFICLFFFCLGISFILSSSMVFFRDTQFLWGILSMLWMYLTPIFYPISIIPENLRFLINANPMYHIIRFIRVVILQGISPTLAEYFNCAIFALVPLLVGLLIFKRTQNRFALYL